MSPTDSVALVDLLGFVTGAALYGMLLAMVARVPAQARPPGASRAEAVDALAPLTACLGLLWNLGALAVSLMRGAGVAEPSEVVEAFAFVALGFLPAVVVHSALLTEGRQSRSTRLVVWAAYALSAASGLLHLLTVVEHDIAHSWSLRLLTGGICLLIVALFALTRGQPKRGRAVWALSLALFAVSALHLSRHAGTVETVWVEIVGHHASLPLALAILYQDYKFALADLFLKRALSLIALTALVIGVYVAAVGPYLLTGAEGGPRPGAVAVLLILWVATALAYPALRHGITTFVDAAILRRPDLGALGASIGRELSALERPEAMLDLACERLAPALAARGVFWACPDAEDAGGDAGRGERWRAVTPAESARLLSEWARREGWVTVPAPRAARGGAPEHLAGARAVVTIPTVEPPTYLLLVVGLEAGRRFMSDELALLNAVASALARRVDAVRVAHVRCLHELREQETSKLATEAELKALRAQINPHFLFNALTTIGYLIQTSPDRALDTLMRLTGLLRAVLKSSGEFSTLGEEIDLVESYLDIEHERFEERLAVRIDVPEALRALRLPSLVVQPLVENAIKHAIAPSASGGAVRVEARLDAGDPPELVVEVSDTGSGAMPAPGSGGVGLSSIRRRLECHYGGDASLWVESTPGEGTTATLRIPAGDAARLSGAGPAGRGARP